MNGDHRVGVRVSKKAKGVLPSYQPPSDRDWKNFRENESTQRQEKPQEKKEVDEQQ